MLPLHSKHNIWPPGALDREFSGKTRPPDSPLENEGGDPLVGPWRRGLGMEPPDFMGWGGGAPLGTFRISLPAVLEGGH